MIFPNFPKNCMKLKEFGPGGGRACLVPPLDPSLTCQEVQSYLQENQQKTGSKKLHTLNIYMGPFYTKNDYVNIDNGTGSNMSEVVRRRKHNQSLSV